MRIVRLAGSLAAVAALTAVTSTPAAAIPNPTGADDGLFTIHLVVPDPASPTRMCTISYRPTSEVRFVSTGLATGQAEETGRISVTSSGCPSVTWTSVAIVKDESPGRPTISRVAAGGTSATVSQTVPYGIGVREASLVTFELYVSSRLGFFCWEDVWQVSALGNPFPVGTGPC